MKELNVTECKKVNGGIAPLIGFAASVAGSTMARTAASYVVSRVGLIAGTYGLGDYFTSNK